MQTQTSAHNTNARAEHTVCPSNLTAAGSRQVKADTKGEDWQEEGEEEEGDEKKRKGMRRQGTRRRDGEEGKEHE
jgi:hypothetical protein